MDVRYDCMMSHQNEVTAFIYVTYNRIQNMNRMNTPHKALTIFGYVPAGLFSRCLEDFKDSGTRESDTQDTFSDFEDFVQPDVCSYVTTYLVKHSTQSTI